MTWGDKFTQQEVDDAFTEFRIEDGQIDAAHLKGLMVAKKDEEWRGWLTRHLTTYTLYKSTSASSISDTIQVTIEWRKRSIRFGSEINQSVEDVQPNRGRARVSLSVRRSGNLQKSSPGKIWSEEENNDDECINNLSGKPNKPHAETPKSFATAECFSRSPWYFGLEEHQSWLLSKDPRYCYTSDNPWSMRATVSPAHAQLSLCFVISTLQERGAPLLKRWWFSGDK